MVNGDDNRIAKILYKYMFLKNSDNQFRSDWLKYIKDILDKCGYSNIWLSQGNFNSKWLGISLKQKLFDQFQQKWRADIDCSSKVFFSLTDSLVLDSIKGWLFGPDTDIDKSFSKNVKFEVVSTDKKFLKFASELNEMSPLDSCYHIDKRNFVRNPPAGVQFQFEFEASYPVAMATLQEDSNLQKMRFDLVPKQVKEDIFWRNYFYRVSLIKQSTQLTSLAQETGSMGSKV
ncbi:Hypothetical predicted protein [Mytilus galloprovincialis]|uniref:BSD domain-containing protein n=1 Tax=Mytilus galloprovincialis TaxID=29158 RepID=A0A8B6CC80_MYTGA|nr:Hypothetical predicted protein [Mytilus galloprovincialis]